MCEDLWGWFLKVNCDVIESAEGLYYDEFGCQV